MEKINRQSKYFFILTCSVFLSIIVVSFYSIFFKNDYEVLKWVECDPSVDSCFVADCETGDTECDSETTYKKIIVTSKYAGLDYDSLDCSANSDVCQVVTCQENTIEVGEKCFQ